MSDKTQTIRAAIATKANASTGALAAGMRRALAKVDEPLSMLPELRILQPSAKDVTDRPTALQERYTLTIPAELVMPKPGGQWRQDPIAADIADALGVEFRSGVKLGLSSYVDRCDLDGWSEGLQEYADTDLPGLRLVFTVMVTETFDTPRTA